MKKKSIIFIVSHPIQYYIPIYQGLSKNEDVQLKVLFASDETIRGSMDNQFGIPVKWDIPMLEGYTHQFLKNYSFKPSIHNGFFGLFNPGVIKELARSPKSLVVINGWSNLTNIIGFVAAKLFGHKVAIRSEAPYYKELRPPTLKNRIRHFLLRYILLKHLVDYFLYIGQQNLSFYKYYNVQNDRLVFTPYSVDNVRFESEIEGKDKIRRELGIQNDCYVVLFVGKLILVKRPFDIVDAFLKLKHHNKKLILVGDGNLKTALEEKYKDFIGSQLIITGFVNQSKISKYYIASDVLVLCSESETWGLTVNEAMIFGLPVVVYDSVGCASDLVKDGQNGYIVKKGDIQSLADALTKVSGAQQENQKMQDQSRAIISKYSIQSTIEGFNNALDLYSAAHGKNFADTK